jgi:ceramide glucosyltransferase
LPLVFLYWFFVGPALLLAALSLRGERKRAAYVARRLAASLQDLPPATVIVPVKGYDEGLRENLGALATLDYPDYELIVTARSAADIPMGVLPARVKVVLAHGPETGGSEKIQNLMAAVRAARKRSRVLAFADSDGRVTSGWLRALVAPLSEPGVGASTGYRWFLPDPPDFWSLMRGVWDAVAAGTLGPGDNPFAWGGAMAIRKEVFFDVRVPEFWQGALSDDYALSQAVHAAGLSIAYAPGRAHAVPGAHHRRPFLRLDPPPDGGHADLRAAAVVARPDRAHLLLRRNGGVHRGSIRGNRLAEWALIAQLSPGMLKGLNRATLAKASLPEHEAWFKRHAWVHAIWVPLVTWVWLIALVSSAFARSIEWRGRRYALKRGGPESSR